MLSNMSFIPSSIHLSYNIYHKLTLHLCTCSASFKNNREANVFVRKSLTEIFSANLSTLWRFFLALIMAIHSRHCSGEIVLTSSLNLSFIKQIRISRPPTASIVRISRISNELEGASPLLNDGLLCHYSNLLYKS